MFVEILRRTNDDNINESPSTKYEICQSILPTTRFSCTKEEPGNEASSYPGSFGKDPGIGWSRDSTKINCPKGSGKVSNYMIPQNTLNFKLYQEWDFTIHSSKRRLTSILYLCLLLNYKNTVAFYQQSSQETNKTY